MPLKFHKKKKKKEFFVADYPLAAARSDDLIEEKERVSVADYPLAAALSGDLIIEIFYRLSADSLFRFKTVCKQWNKVISSPFFAHRYRRKNPNPVLTGFYFHLWTDHLDPRLTDPIFFISDDEISPIFIDDRLTFLPNRRRVAVCDSDKGLVLYSSTRYHAKNFFVCNPLTTQCVALPILPKGKKCSYARLMCLGEDKDYHFKVIVFLFPNNPQQFECRHVMIFTSETGQWKECDLIGSPYMYINNLSFALHKGIIYFTDWLHMGAFNVEIEHLRFLNWPDGSKGSCNRCLRVSGGSLYLTLGKEQDEQNDILIWVFNDEGDIAKWTLCHSISISALMNGNPEILDRVNYYKRRALRCDYRQYFYAMAIHHMNPQVIFLKMPGNIVLYDIENTMSEVVWDDEEVCVHHNGPNDCYMLNMVCCSEVYPFALPAWPIEIPAFINAHHLR